MTDKTTDGMTQEERLTATAQSSSRTGAKPSGALAGDESLETSPETDKP